ncbi:hypothetical protein [Paenibacillus sp. BAC0078]
MKRTAVTEVLPTIISGPIVCNEQKDLDALLLACGEYEHLQRRCTRLFKFQKQEMGKLGGIYF